MAHYDFSSKFLGRSFCTLYTVDTVVTLRSRTLHWLTQRGDRLLSSLHCTCHLPTLDSARRPGIPPLMYRQHDYSIQYMDILGSILNSQFLVQFLSSSVIYIWLTLHGNRGGMSTVQYNNTNFVEKYVLNIGSICGRIPNSLLIKG